MPPVQILLICALAASTFLGARVVVHGVKAATVKTSHAVVHVVTFGKK